MGLISTQKVVARAEYYGRRSILQSGNREWATAIEVICADRSSLPLHVIFQAKAFIEGWFDNFPRDWRIEVLNNGWTTGEIGLC